MAHWGPCGSREKKSNFLTCVWGEISLLQATTGYYNLFLIYVPPYKSGEKITEDETLPGLTLTLRRGETEHKSRTKKGSREKKNKFGWGISYHLHFKSGVRLWGGDRPRAWKGIRVPLAHLFRVLFFFFFFVVWGPMCVGKDGPEAANGSFTDGSLTISLLGFWAWSCWYENHWISSTS